MADADETHSSSSSNPTGTQSDQFFFNDRIVRLFAVATVFWAMVSLVLTIATTTILIDPRISIGAPEIAFGRISSLHLNAAIYGFAFNAVFTGIYYITQRLCQRPLWSSLLGYLHFVGWQGLLIYAGLMLSEGVQAHRYIAQMPVEIDWAIVGIWGLLFATNFFMTLFTRRHRHMYISLWFFTAAVLSFPVVHCVNTLAVGQAAFGQLTGIQDAFLQSWYLHGLLIYVLIMPTMGILYYLVPKITEQPIYNYKLAIIQFWALVVFGGFAGSRFLHFTAVPEWISSLGMLSGFLLWMPYWAGVVNGLGTLSDGRRSGVREPAMKFLTAGVIVFAFATLEGTWSAIKSVSATTLYTDWTLAHLYALTFGWVALISMGMLYWIMPKIFQTRGNRSALATSHFGLAILGVFLHVGAMYGAGFVQSSMTHAMDSTGILLYPEYVDITKASRPMWILSAAGAVISLLGFALLGLNLLMSWFGRQRPYQTTAFDLPKLSCQYDDASEPPSRLEGTPVLGLGSKIDVWTRLTWHRRWERKSLRFTACTGILVVLLTLLQVAAVLAFTSPVTESPSTKALTPLELAGRSIFVEEGCVSCHSQAVRPLVSETARYNRFSQPEDYQNEWLALWGHRRIGPDLAQESGRRDSFWHWRHLENPRSEYPDSVMPSYQYLLREPLDLDAIRNAVEEAQGYGLSYDAELEDLAACVERDAEVVAADIVKAGGPAALFDKQATALIAYLQRLGKEFEPEQQQDTAASAEQDSQNEPG